MTSRRDFITLVGGAAAWPVVARGQYAATPVIGFLSARAPSESAPVVAAFHRGLGEFGYVEGQSIAIEYRWAEGEFGRLPALAADLVRRKVTLIVATGGTSAALAAKHATSTIPIVASGSDPVRFGIVPNLNRPSGNVTFIDMLLSEMEGKRLGLLRELVPSAALIAVLLDSRNPAFDDQIKDVEGSARRLGQRIKILHATSQQEIDAAFSSMTGLKPSALLVGATPLFNSRREQIVTLANHYKLPTIYEVREFALAGGLMSYGTSLPEAYRQIGVYTGRILKGEKPGDLPVFRMSKFEFVINLKTAKMLSIDVPGTISARADEIIE